MTRVDVSDLNLHRLIMELWRATRAPLFNFALDSITDEELADEAERALLRKNIKYMLHKPMRVDLRNPVSVCTRGYDRQAGEGQFMRVVNELRGD